MYNSPTYYPNPAMQTAQQRLQMMEAQYPQFASNQPMYPQQGMYPAQQMQSQPQAILRGRLVSNEEEANAAMIDFDGSLFVFPDKAHGKIYTKQLGLDGNIIFCRYSMDQGVPNQAKEPEKAPAGIDLSPYVTKEELTKGMDEMRSYLTNQLDQLTSSTGGVAHEHE